MKNIYALLILTSLFLSCTQEAKEEVFENPEENNFPDSWTGKYEGELLVTTHGETTDTSTMMLQMYRLDMNRTAFQIKYKSDSSVRDYELAPGKTPNHFVLDEKNSILIDYYYQNNELTSRFSVDDNMIDINLRKQGDSITATTRVIPLNFNRETGDSVQWKIMRYKERAVQRAVLHKVNP